MLALTTTCEPSRSNGASKRRRRRSAARQRVVEAAEVLEQDRELVAAEARDGVGRARRGADALGRQPDQLIAAEVPEAVVDELEVVEVDHQHADRPAAALQRGAGARSNSARLGTPVRDR